jgi:hypothetical protein
MRMTLALLWISIVSLTLGCQKPAVSPDPTVIQIRQEQADKDRLCDATLEVLRRHLWTIDRLDRIAGVISTRPETSQQFFEFWRKDVATPFDLFESSLSPIRRRVTVNIEPTAADAGENEWNFTVKVEKQRLRSPERQYNASASALRIFSEELPGAAGQKQVTRADEYWYDIGRDSAFEDYLLKRILAQAKIAEPAT